MGFEQQTAIVVGAARGIGRTVAERLASRGAAVIGFDRDAGALQEAATSLSAKKLKLESREVDITDAAGVTAAIEHAAAVHSGIHILVNCAGITGKTGIPAHEVEAANFETVLNVNLTGAFLLTKAVIPVMLKQGYGRILHVASISGKDGNAGMLAYSASKAGLIGMVKSAGKDYAESGITINALAPAVIMTDMVAAMPAHQVKYMTDKIPMKRTGKLEEAAAMIEWIVSPECSFTTGFCFDLSGGRATY